MSNLDAPPPYGAEDADYDLTPIPHALNRPRLPQEKRNPHISGLTAEDTIVKFQTIVREGREIVVGRIKIATPGVHSHAFMLRRYDTNAISLSTMYKVAFPGATEEDERREMDWIKSSYDIRNTNGGRGCDAVRLAGQWISRQLAIHLAPAYGLAELVACLSRAIPDPTVAYRKSQRSQAAAEQMARRSNEESDPVPKRQRRQSNEQHLTLEATTTVTAPSNTVVDMEAEIENAKQLVMNLKREIRLKAAAGEALEDQGVESSRGIKRGKGDDEVAEGAHGGERVIKRSKRVENARGETAKKLAWSGLIFGMGIGVATLLPSLTGWF